jgi:hypothetical protein
VSPVGLVGVVLKDVLLGESSLWEVVGDAREEVVSISFVGVASVLAIGDDLRSSLDVNMVSVEQEILHTNVALVF